MASPKKQMSWTTFFFILVIIWGLAVAYGNRSEDPCPPGGCKPVPHSTITPDDVHDLPDPGVSDLPKDK